MPKRIYLNRMQQEVMYTGARDTVVVAGRGTGKGVLHALQTLRNIQSMPGSTTAIVAPNAKRAKTNTLPSMLMHLEEWGYRRGIHWEIGRKPPAKLGWPKPLIEPDDWENILSFYTGAIGQIISQDRIGTSNSKSFDFLDIDEAKFIDFEKLKDETFQANRGQLREFGSCPWHHGILVTSDMPTTKRGSWFLRYEQQADNELIRLLQQLVTYRAELLLKISERKGSEAYLRQRIRELDADIAEFRRHALLYRVYSSLTNVHVLGMDYILKMKRDLPPLVFQTSILCMPVEILKDGFYSSMKPGHKYAAIPTSYTEGLEYGSSLVRPDCRMDGDLQADLPLCIAFDFNSNINWLVVGQAVESLRRLNVVRSFFVKYERKLPELVRDFCKYFSYFPNKTVVFYYDHTALGSNYAVNDQDYRWVIVHELELAGWNVIEVYIGRAMAHLEKYLLINRGFAGEARLMPFFNEEGNNDLLTSIQLAGVFNGKKDKRGEKLAETEEDRLEARTDGSDAFDTLYIGCERFPQETSTFTSSSNWSS